MTLRVLVASYLPPGHLFGPLGVALAARDAGHDVTYWLPSFGRDVVATMNLPTVHAGHWDGGPGTNLPSGGLPDDPVRAAADGLYFSYVTQLSTQLDEFNEVLDRVRPDVVLCGATVLGLHLAAAARGIPVATLVPTTYYPVGDDIPPAFFGLRQANDEPPGVVDDVRARWADAEKIAVAEIADVRSRLGLPARQGGLMAQFTSPLRTYVPSSPLFDLPGRSIPDHVRYAGDCVSDAASACQLGQSELALPDSFNKPAALVTSGTNAKSDLVREATKDLVRQGFTVIALTWSMQAAEIHDPPHVYATSYLPMRHALSLVDVVVTNGGSGGVLQSLSVGRPLLVRPDGQDQGDNAVRVVAAGVGRRQDLDDGDFGTTAWSLLERPDYREAVRGMSTDLRARGGPAGIVADLETLAGGGSDD